MITATWMFDADRNLEYLECKKIMNGNELRGIRTGIVKVYFDSETDLFIAKNAKLEQTIAETIFSKRNAFAKETVACLEICSYGIFFRTGTTTLLAKEIPQSELRELEEKIEIEEEERLLDGR